MIKLCDYNYISDKFDNNNVFYRKIMSEYMFYKDFEDTFLYCQQRDSEYTCLMLKSGTAITMCIDDDADFDEISEFLEVIGYESLFLDNKFAERLNLSLFNNGHIMLCTKTGKSNEIENRVISVDGEKLKEIYDLVDKCFALGSDFSSWFVDCSHKLRHGFLKIKAITENGKFVSCAFSMYEYENSAVISSVCTKKSCRGKGYAALCIEELKNSLSEHGIDNFYVFCNEGKITDFYKKLDFKDVGRWCEYVRKI